MNIVNGLVRIFQNGEDSWGDYHRFDRDGNDIQELARNFLTQAKKEKRIQSYLTGDASFYCESRGEQGVYFFSWVEQDGRLGMTQYEWED